MFHKNINQGCELGRFLIELKFERHLQVRVQVQRFLFFEFKFEFGKNDQVQVHSPVQNIPNHERIQKILVGDAVLI